MKNHSVAKGIVVGTGIATMAAAIAGTYFLYGSKDAIKNRRKVTIWTLRAKAEILEKLENISEVNEKVYHHVIQEVAKKYQAMKDVDKKEVMEFVKELKGHWKDIAKELGIS